MLKMIENGHHALGLVLTSLLVSLVAPFAQAQDVGPADCPAIEDSEGRRVGPVVGLGLHNASAATQAVEVDETLPIVALAVDGEVFLLGVMRERLVGTLVRHQLLGVDGADCIGTPHFSGADYFDAGPLTWQGGGPVPVSAVFGPSMTLWVMDPDQAAVDYTMRSAIYNRNEDPRTEQCHYMAPAVRTGRPLRRVVDLADHFTPPFRLVDGRCPGPGRGGR